MIFYFSGTGNTKWVAETIASHINEQILNIADEINGDCVYKLAEKERIGFCFPVHGWQPPGIIRRFISKCHFTNTGNHYCYILCTCGSEVGKTMEIFAHDLRRVGLRVDSFFSLKMPNTYIALPFMDTDGEEMEKKKLSEAGNKLISIAHSIKDCSCGLKSVTEGPAPFILSHIIGQFFNLMMITDKPFHVNIQKCINCGLCAKVCPTNNILINNEMLPQWLHINKCTCCMACFHHCPTHAINYGNATQSKGQYFIGKYNQLNI